MVNLPHGQEIQGSLGVRSLLLRSILRLVWLNALSVATYRLNPQWRLHADYDLRFQTVGIAIQHKWLNFGMRVDSTNMDIAKAYGVTAGINIPF